MLQPLDRLSRRIYRALHLSGYARIDFRVRGDGSMFMLEANANPNLDARGGLRRIGARCRHGYRELLERIMELGCNYRNSRWRATYG